MTDFNEAAEFVRRHSEKWRDFIALGDRLKEIGSIDLAAKERQEALDKVSAALATATSDLANAKAEHESFLATREADLEAHRAEATAITDKAKKDAAGIVDAANEAGANAIASANAEAARIQGAHAETMAAANAELQAARTQLDAINNEIAGKNAERDSLAAAIEGMKKLARTALGPT